MTALRGPAVFVARTLLASALYGFSLGSAHSELYALRNLVKFPLLILVTTALCSISYYLIVRALVCPLSFARVQRVAWQLFHDGAVMMASLSPIVLFFGWTSRALDDGRLGFYDSFLALNVVVVGVSGTVALARQVRGLIGEDGVAVRKAMVLTATWLTLSLAVGGQAAFYMRPFFGLPATRGGSPPFFLGAEPDVRGATNFYEMVWQTVIRPPLPRGFGRARRGG